MKSDQNTEIDILKSKMAAFKTVLIKKEDSYYLAVPKLGQIFSGKTPTQVYENFESRCDTYLKEISDFGIEKQVLAELSDSPENFVQNLTRLARKGSMFIIFIVFFIGIFGTLVHRISKKQIEKIPYRLERMSNVSQEKKLRRVKRFREVLEGLGPYLLEVKKVLSDSKESNE